MRSTNAAAASAQSGQPGGSAGQDQHDVLYRADDRLAPPDHKRRVGRATRYCGTSGGRRTENPWPTSVPPRRRRRVWATSAPFPVGWRCPRGGFAACSTIWAEPVADRVGGMLSSVELHSDEFSVFAPQPDWPRASRRHRVLVMSGRHRCPRRVRVCARGQGRAVRAGCRRCRRHLGGYGLR